MNHSNDLADDKTLSPSFFKTLNNQIEVVSKHNLDLDTSNTMLIENESRTPFANQQINLQLRQSSQNMRSKQTDLFKQNNFEGRNSRNDDSEKEVLKMGYLTNTHFFSVKTSDQDTPPEISYRLNITQTEDRKSDELFRDSAF